MRSIGFVAASVLLLASCGGGDAAKPPPQVQPRPTVAGSPLSPASAPTSSSVDEAALDRSVQPCDDFYAHACGGWMQSTKIPDDESSWTRSFSTIRDRNEEILRDILERYARGEGDKEPYAKALGDFYASCMDEAGIEKAGTLPLQNELKVVDQVKDAATLSKAMAAIAARGLPGPITFSSQQDFQDATQVIAYFEQSGLGMPDRDYYVDAEPKMKDLRAKYEAHVMRMFELLGDKAAKKNAATILKIESALAKASMTKVERRDPKKIYHRMTAAQLKETGPHIAWDAFYATLGSKDLGIMNVAQPDFVKALDKMAAGGLSFDEWRVYLRWHVLRGLAPTMPAKFVDEAFAWKRALQGAKSLAPRWKRCVRATDGALGEALAQPFVQKTLGGEGKSKVLDMIHAVEGVMKDNLNALSWMDKGTREQAQKKLAKIANKIAYPDKWRTYEGLTVERGAYLANSSRAATFEAKRQLAKVGKPVDRNEWYMTPPTVNAYYDPSMNEMVFPAGILQPPFYGNARSTAANFGGVGMVMGHELTHGFDDEGRQFDAEGNLRDWWSPEVNTEFEKRASCVEKQFDDYTVLDTVHVNGKLTLGENIADLGGVKLALAALRTKTSQGTVTSGRYTPEQEFFYGFAQGWCTLMRDEALRMLVATNPHAPPKLRVNGPLANLPEFAQAFQCKPTSPMVRGEGKRCDVW